VARHDPLFFFGLFFLATPACLSSSLWPLLSVSHPLCPYPPPSVDQTAAPPTSMADSGRLPPTIPNPNSTSLLLSDLHAPPSSLPPNQSGRWGHMGSHGHTDYLDFLEKIISAAYWKKNKRTRLSVHPGPKHTDNRAGANQVHAPPNTTNTGSGEWRSGRWRSWIPARRAAAGTTAAAASQLEPSTAPFPFTTPMCPPPRSGRSASLPPLHPKP
jgi:hypothetical protein